MIKEITTKYELETAAKFGTIIFENSSFEENLSEFKDLVSSDKGTLFVAYYDDEMVGFSQVETRSDYVEGTESSPVGYLEGVYVKDDFRMMGIGRELVKACEDWSKSKGYKEFASDCELTNKTSYDFHIKIGFSEANRIICFKKDL